MIRWVSRESGLDFIKYADDELATLMAYVRKFYLSLQPNQLDQLSGATSGILQTLICSFKDALSTHSVLATFLYKGCWRSYWAHLMPCMKQPNNSWELQRSRHSGRYTRYSQNCRNLLPWRLLCCIGAVPWDIRLLFLIWLSPCLGWDVLVQTRQGLIACDPLLGSWATVNGRRGRRDNANVNFILERRKLHRSRWDYDLRADKKRQG